MSVSLLLRCPKSSVWSIIYLFIYLSIYHLFMLIDVECPPHPLRTLQWHFPDMDGHSLVDLLLSTLFPVPRILLSALHTDHSQERVFWEGSRRWLYKASTWQPCSQVILALDYCCTLIFPCQYELLQLISQCQNSPSTSSTFAYTCSLPGKHMPPCPWFNSMESGSWVSIVSDPPSKTWDASPPSRGVLKKENF